MVMKESKSIMNDEKGVFERRESAECQVKKIKEFMYTKCK